MTRKLAFLVTAVACVLAANPAAVRAQKSAMPVVGWLNPQPLASSRHLLNAFLKGLGEASR